MRKVIISIIIISSILFAGCSQEKQIESKEVQELKIENAKLKSENLKLQKQLEILQRNAAKTVKEPSVTSKK